MFNNKNLNSETDDFSELYANSSDGFFDGDLENKKLKKEKDKKEKRLAIMSSTQSFSRILDIKDGIIITADYEYVCIVEVSPINFWLMDAAERDAVVGRFVGALAVLPKNVQIKCLSRKQDVERRIDRMVARLRTETNPTCRTMLIEQIQLVERMAFECGITRRFFVIFKYEPKDSGGLFKNPLSKIANSKPEWDVVRDQLHRCRNQFEMAISNCGNKILSKAYDDNYLLATLYDILHPYSNDEDYVSLEDRVRMVNESHNIHDGDQLFVSPNDILAYNTINTKNANYIEADGVYYAFAYVGSQVYRMTGHAGWLGDLVNLGAGIDLDIFLTKESKAKALNKLQQGTKLNMVTNNDVDASNPEKYALKNKMDSSEILMAKLMSGNDEFCYLSCVLTVTASSEESIRDLIPRVEEYCKSRDLPVTFCRFQQIAAFQSVMPPLCKLDPNIYKLSRRNIMMSDAASIYPFVANILDDPEGVLYGQARSGGLVFVDNFNVERYMNGNMIIVGTTGAGKTYTLACLCLRYREMGIQTFVISPAKGHEFRQAAESVDGQRVCIWPGSPDNINIMEIRKHKIVDEEREESLLVNKIDSLHTFIGLLLPDITVEEIEALDKAIIACYGKFGITKDNASLEVVGLPGVYKRMPLIEDLYNELLKLGDVAKRLSAVLSQFVTGFAASFNQPTNVDLDNQFIAFDVSKAEDNSLFPYKAICMFIAMDLIWDKVQEDRTKKKLIVLDELWQLIGASASQETSQYVLNIFKLIRGYGGVGIAATQDISDFFNDEHGRGKAIVNSCEFKCIMKLKKQEADFAKTVIEIDPSGVDQIVNNFNRGDMLLMAGSENAYLHVVANSTEHSLITTRRDELAEREKAKGAAS